MGFQDLVAVMPWTIILQICNLLLQIWLFKKFLLKPVQNILRQRQELVNADLDAAAKANEEAQQSKEEYAKSLEGAKEEAAELVRSAAKTAQTKEEAAAIRAKASDDIARERKNAANEMKNDISDLAVSIASKVVEKEISEEEHAKLIEDFIDKMGDAV